LGKAFFLSLTVYFALTWVDDSLVVTVCCFDDFIEVFFDVVDLVHIIYSPSLAVLVAFENVGGAFVLVCGRMKVAVRRSPGLLVQSIIGLIIP